MTKGVCFTPVPRQDAQGEHGRHSLAYCGFEKVSISSLCF